MRCVLISVAGEHHLVMIWLSPRDRQATGVQSAVTSASIICSIARKYFVRDDKINEKAFATHDRQQDRSTSIPLVCGLAYRFSVHIRSKKDDVQN